MLLTPSTFLTKLYMLYNPLELGTIWEFSLCIYDVLIHTGTQPETLPQEVLGKMGAPPKTDVPIMTPNELPEADGLLLGFPTRFGLMAAQFKVFMDATGGLWCTQTLARKSAGIFYSIGSEGGGQQTTP